MFKKNDLVLIEKSTYISCIGKPGYREKSQELCRVASASRDGKVKAIADLRYGTVQKFTGYLSNVRLVAQRAAEKLVAARKGGEWNAFIFDSVEDFETALAPFKAEVAAEEGAKPAGPKPGTKGYRMHYKASKTGHAPAFTDRDYERQAVAYARWLAERDGIEIPAEATAKIDWSGVTVDHDQITGRKLDKQRYERRVWEVDFSMRIELRNGYRFEKIASIRIPNWDHVRVPAVDETDVEELFLQAAE